jgi:hypothetical protein
MVHTLEEDWRQRLGVQRIDRVAGSGHYIHKDRPEVVVEALDSLIGELAAKQRSAH